MKANRTTKEQREKMVELYKDGYNYSEIAERLDVAISTVSYHLHKMCLYSISKDDDCSGYLERVSERLSFVQEENNKLIKELRETKKQLKIEREKLELVDEFYHKIKAVMG